MSRKVLHEDRYVRQDLLLASDTTGRHVVSMAMSDGGLAAFAGGGREGTDAGRRWL